MLDHFFGMLSAAFLIVLLLGFLTGGLSTAALYFLSFCSVGIVASLLVEVIRDIRNGNW